MNSDTAASDLIAVLILIAVFVTAAAIVGVVLLSHPPGDRPPAMLAHNETEGETLYIYHDGGDPLERGRFAILIDGADRTADFALIDASGNPSTDWTSWKTGQALALGNDVPENPHIRIVAEGIGRTGGGWLLHDFGNGTTAVAPTVTATTVPTTEPTTEPTQVPLVADFTADPTSGSAPLAVAFTDTSAGGPTSWSWHFGDGGTSTERNPVHTYTAEGTYTVKLTVENALGSDTVTKTGYITVTEEHVSRLEVNSVGQAPMWWHVPVNGVRIDYAGDLAGFDTTPFVLSKTYVNDSGFNVTLTAPDRVEVQFWLWPWPWPIERSLEFKEWWVGDTRYMHPTIKVSVPDAEGRIATACYTIGIFP